MNKIPCPHAKKLTRTEGAQHMACTAYGREVNPRALDRWANDGLITREKVGGLQWVRFDRDELTAMAAGEHQGQPVVERPRQASEQTRRRLRRSARDRRCPQCKRKSALVATNTDGTDLVCRWRDCLYVVGTREGAK